MKKKRKLNINIKRGFLLFLSIIIIGLSGSIFLLYGPWSGFRNLLITTAMTTKSHHYLATWFYSDEEIARVLAYNKVIESGEDTDTSLIDFEEDKEYDSIYEKQILERDEDALYKVIDISGTGYKGYLVAVYDPSKVKIGTTSKLGTTGQSTKVIAKNYNAHVAINAGGFYDPDWNSNGAIPHGTVIQNGKVVWDYEDANVGGGIVGFNQDNVLVLGRMTARQAINKGIRDAVEFGPFLIVNGKASFVRGDGGWGIAPRTAIGQRQDGIVLMLVIDGRGYQYGRPDILGCGMVELTEIMQRYGAVNAANMDGGSSTSLILEGEVASHPVAGGSEGLRNIPTAWIVTD